MLQIKERIGKLIEQIGELRYSNTCKVSEYAIKRGKIEEDTGWDKMDKSGIWGGNREHFCFKTSVVIPEEFKGKTVIYELRTGKEGEWDAINPQFLIFVNGKVRCGLDVNHRTVVLSENAVAGERYEILLHSYTGDNNYTLFMDSEIKVLDRKIEKFYYDIKVPYDVMRMLSPDDENGIFIRKSLNESLNLLDMRVSYSKEFYESLELAQKYLYENFYSEMGKDSPVVYCVGHTHIDIAWLWTLATTEDKAVRSFSTVLDLMDRYPEYIFMSSQPQLYKYVKKNAPEVYEKIKQRVAEGRWECEGGMFVEADCNLASGESLVRQFLYGKDFFKKEFGSDNEILWLPDVFGYSAALPQIMKKCGIKYFMTTKISWNEFNKMPHDTFMWKGIDGTEILTHFIPTRDFNKAAQEGGTETEHFTTYNGMLTPSMVKGAWQRYSDKELNNEVLMSYGYGDGGGGVTSEMLEVQRRMNKGICGAPITKPSTALQFFKKLERDAAGNKNLPKWVGELYLEYHRGTYTSMARNKKFNRKAEFLLGNIELFSTMADAFLGTEYPKEELNEEWEVVLRNQFHDILPGSAIKDVYEDSLKEYTGLFDRELKRQQNLYFSLAENIDAGKNSVVIFNPNSDAISAPVEIKGLDINKKPFALFDGEKYYQIQESNNKCIAIVDGINAKGYKTFDVVGYDADSEIYVSKDRVETSFFSIKFNAKMQFESIYDKKAGREIIPEGKVANEIISYENKPHNFDAWDINIYYTEKSWPVDDVSECEIVESGPVRACIKVERKYLSSVVIQYLYFYNDLYRIDIRNEIDWKEDQILLRDYFPVDVNCSEATFDIQYGNVKRPTHANTSWDEAKFEVCAHKWFDVAEDGYGVAFLNDCKYGCSVKENVAGMTMLKTARYPNPDGDKEHHTFWYSICPHLGDFREGQIIEKAYNFNNPYVGIVKSNDGGEMPKDYSFISVDAPNVKIEIVKKALNSEEIIIRIYECYNRRTKATLKFGCEVSRAFICDMLENHEAELEVDESCVSVELNPFEIITLSVVPEK